MNKEKFWQTIESVNRLVPDGDHEMVQEQMHKELLRYSPQDILDWDLILREYENAAYRNDLWAACTALGAHASDDGFDYFRTWLISQGKDIYMEAMRDPDTLASNPHSGKEMSFEAFAYCAIEAYKEKLHLTGKDSYTKPFDDLDKHKLSDELVQDIINEIPQHPDMSGIDLPLDYSAQFPHIWERMKAHAPETSPAESGSNSIFSMRRMTFSAGRFLCNPMWSYILLEILWGKRCQDLPLFLIWLTTNWISKSNTQSLPCPLANLSVPRTAHISTPITALFCTTAFGSRDCGRYWTVKK